MWEQILHVSSELCACRLCACKNLSHSVRHKVEDTLTSVSCVCVQHKLNKLSKFSLSDVYVHFVC